MKNGIIDIPPVIQLWMDITTIKSIVYAEKCVEKGVSISQGVQAMSKRIKELEIENKRLNDMLNR